MGVSRGTKTCKPQPAVVASRAAKAGVNAFWSARIGSLIGADPPGRVLRGDALP